MTFDRKKAEAYNASHAENSWSGITEAVAIAQERLGLVVDGMLGPKTESALLARRQNELAIESTLTVDIHGWLVGEKVEIIASHRSWWDGFLKTPGNRPAAIVAHRTATKPGTGRAMAKNHKRTLDEVKAERGHIGSWHISNEADGTIIQMAPLTMACHHAGGKNKIDLPGLGHPNYYSVGIEHVGDYLGTLWPEAQILSACRIYRAIVQWAPMSKERASYGHRDCSKKKKDPGQRWYDEVLPRVLAYAYGGAK